MPPVHRSPSPIDALNDEIVQEQAAALGRLGRGLEAALNELREFDAAHPRWDVSREERQARRILLTTASHALWMLVVQREACGLSESRSLMRDYAGACGSAAADGGVSGSPVAVRNARRRTGRGIPWDGRPIWARPLSHYAPASGAQIGLVEQEARLCRLD
jgi:hypothetical protein